MRVDPVQTYNRGRAYGAKGLHDRAIQDFDQAIKLDPSDADNFYERSLAKAKKGDKQGADADLAAARRIDPNVGK
jgi:tetratricopeptide (TPR) repeat protein